MSLRARAVLVAVLAPPSLAAAQRTVTVRNLCAETVWPAVLTQLGSAPNGATGWEAAPQTSLSFTATQGWRGRVWARTGCDFSKPVSSSQCETGGCDNGLLCSSTVSGPPASFVELTLSSGGSGISNFDFYDISLVDGFNLPIAIAPTDTDNSCPTVACVADLLADCPSQLSIERNGKTVACSSACRAGLGGNASNSTNCCSGAFNTPATCPPSSVQFYDYFHSKCPNVYASPFDDEVGLRQCTSSATGPNYEITFCRATNVTSPATNASATGTTSPPTSGTPSSQSPDDSSASVPHGTQADNEHKSLSEHDEPPPTSSAAATSSKPSLAPVIAGGTVGSVVLLTLAGGLFFWLFRRGRKQQRFLAHPHTFHNAPAASSQHHPGGSFENSPISYSQNNTAGAVAGSPVSSRVARGDMPYSGHADSPLYPSSAASGPSFMRRSSSVRSPPPAYSIITTR